MGCIYCLFSTIDGELKYVGQTSSNPEYRAKQHVTAALEKLPGPLYDWIRTIWRRGGDINMHTLQSDVLRRDLDTFEEYWLGQFAGLLNASDAKEGPTKDSAIATQVRVALAASVKKRDD